jgi:hypothetical protein
MILRSIRAQNGRQDTILVWDNLSSMIVILDIRLRYIEKLSSMFKSQFSVYTFRNKNAIFNK